MRPPCESRRLCYTSFDVCLGTSALALLAGTSTTAHIAFSTEGRLDAWPTAVVGPRCHTARIRTEARSDGTPGCDGLTVRYRGLPLRGGRSRLPLEPSGLGIHAGESCPCPTAPWARDRARRAAETRDHPSAAATGHTLPRPVGCLRLILAVVCLAGHEAMRLAFRA
jgi:hypothetical protein